MFGKCLSFGKYGQWFAGTVISLCSLSVGELYGWSAAVLPKINGGTAGFTLSNDESALMVTLLFVGGIIVPVPCGVMMNTIGRRNTVITGLLLGMLAWLILAVSKAIVALYVSRVLAGFWSGIVFTAVPAYMGEVVDSQIRDTFGSIFGLGLLVGGLYESLAAYLTYDWFIYVSSIPTVVLFLGFVFLPESPYYFLMKGEREKAKAAIIWLKGFCKDEELDFIKANVEDQMKMKGSYLDIFRSKAGRTAFLIVEVSYICQRLAGMSFLFAYISVIIPDSWASGQDSFLILTLTCSVFATLSVFIVDSYDRKTLLAISCVGSGLCMGANAVWYYLRDKTDIDTSSTDWLPMTLIVVTAMFYSFGMISIPTILQSELYPVNIKSQGCALAVITAGLFSGLSTQFFYDINENIGLYFNFVVMTISPFVWLVFTLFFVIETRGKSLETIQDILNGCETNKFETENFKKT